MLNSFEDSQTPSSEIHVSSADAVKLSSLAQENNSDHLMQETPKAKSKRSSARITSQSSPQLKSRKSGLLSFRSKDELETLNKKTSEQVIKSVYHLIKSKFPQNYGKKELSAKDQDDIQAFFLKKKSEFSQTLHEIYNSKQLNSAKSSKFFKSDSKFTQNIEKEIQQMKHRKKLLKNEIIKKVSEKILKEKLVQKKKKKIEARKKELEEKQIQHLEKEIIMKNIENFYKDRMSMFKESITHEKSIKRILDYEEKVFASSVFKELKHKKKAELLSLKNKYESEIEDLKEKFTSLSH